MASIHLRAEVVLANLLEYYPRDKGWVSLKMVEIFCKRVKEKLMQKRGLYVSTTNDEKSLQWVIDNRPWYGVFHGTYYKRLGMIDLKTVNDGLPWYIVNALKDVAMSLSM